MMAFAPLFPLVGGSNVGTLLGSAHQALDQLAPSDRVGEQQGPPVQTSDEAARVKPCPLAQRRCPRLASFGETRPSNHASQEASSPLSGAAVPHVPGCSHHTDPQHGVPPFPEDLSKWRLRARESGLVWATRLLGATCALTTTSLFLALDQLAPSDRVGEQQGPPVQTSDEAARVKPCPLAQRRCPRLASFGETRPSNHASQEASSPLSGAAVPHVPGCSHHTDPQHGVPPFPEDLSKWRLRARESGLVWATRLLGATCALTTTSLFLLRSILLPQALMRRW